MHQKVHGIFHGNFHARFQEKISRQHFCTPCRDDFYVCFFSLLLPPFLCLFLFLIHFFIPLLIDLLIIQHSLCFLYVYFHSCLLLIISMSFFLFLFFFPFSPFLSIFCRPSFLFILLFVLFVFCSLFFVCFLLLLLLRRLCWVKKTSQLCPPQGSFWALRAQSREKSQNEFPGILSSEGPKTLKCKKESKINQDRLCFNYVDSFFRLLDGRKPKGPGRTKNTTHGIFTTLSAFTMRCDSLS